MTFKLAVNNFSANYTPIDVRIKVQERIFPLQADYKIELRRVDLLSFIYSLKPEPAVRVLPDALLLSMRRQK
jgi:hypothetical protein